jgi:acetolactate synthase-1/2/3 large subunit
MYLVVDTRSAFLYIRSRCIDLTFKRKESPSMPKMTGARFISESLDGYGVTHVFLVPSILVHTLYEMERRTPIKRIVTHGEKSAVYMADGYARACGRPGVCMAQAVGAANLAAGLRDPYLACTPIIAFTGGPYPYTRNRNTYQQIEDFPLFKPVTKFSAHVDDVRRLPDVLRQAFRSATTGKPGPVHIELEGHLGEVLEIQEAEFEVLVEERFSSVPPFRPEPEAEAVKAAGDLLTKAKRPIIVAGGGVRASGAAKELLQLAEKLAIPVATSLNAKEVIPGNHPLSVGVVGLYSRKSANRAVLDSDLVFFVGSQTSSQVTFNWKVPPVGTPSIQLDIEPQELGRHYPNRVSLLGDAKVSLTRLLQATEGTKAPSRKQWVKNIQTMVQNWRDEFNDLMNSDQQPIRPERLCKNLSHLLPPDTLLVSDTGHSGMWTGGMIDLTKPGQGFMRAAGSLGWGLPASLGARCASPDRPILLFTGDGGFWYHISEIETALRWNLNVVILVNDNQSLNQGRGPNTRAYGGKLHGRHHELWRFEDVDLAGVAKSIGANGIRVSKPSELSGALEKAFSADKLTVIDVVTDSSAMAPLAFPTDP